MLKRKERRDTVSVGGGEQVEGVHSGERERERAGGEDKEGEGPLTCHSEQETSEALQPSSSAELSGNIWPGLQGDQATDQPAAAAGASTRQTDLSLRPIRMLRR